MARLGFVGEHADVDGYHSSCSWFLLVDVGFVVLFPTSTLGRIEFKNGSVATCFVAVLREES